MMRGYFRNSEATAAVLRDGWLHTGDLVRYDEDGYWYYAGRLKDTVRRRGENVSAWEVERIANEHPDVEESAMVGVATDIGEQDIKLFVKPAAGRRPDPAAIVRWCAERMPYSRSRAISPSSTSSPHSLPAHPQGRAVPCHRR